MKKIFFVVAFLAICITLLAEDYAYPTGNEELINGGNLGYTFDPATGKGKWRPIAVDGNGQVKMTGSMPAVEVDTSDIKAMLVATETIVVTDPETGEETIIQKPVSVGSNSQLIKTDVEKIKASIRATTETSTVIGELKEIKNAIPAGSSSPWTSNDITTLLEDKLGSGSNPNTLLGYTSDTASYLYHTVAEEGGSSSYSAANILYNMWKKNDTVTMDTFICDASGASAATPTTLELTDSLFKTAVQESSPVTDLTTRVFIELRAEDPEATFKIAFRNDFEYFYRLVKGRIVLQCNNQSVWIKAESPVKLFITEGWK